MTIGVYLKVIESASGSGCGIGNTGRYGKGIGVWSWKLEHRMFESQ